MDVEKSAQSQTKTTSSRIWTRVADSIFYDDKPYTKRTLTCAPMCEWVCVCVRAFVWACVRTRTRVVCVFACVYVWL